MSIVMQLISAVVFWLVLYFGYMKFFEISERCRGGGIGGHFKYLVSLTVLIISVMAVTEWNWVVPARQKTQAKFYGAPIASNVQSLEGRVFKPQAFIVTEQHILVYDKDGKVYTLDGIMLDGITPEKLTVASNVTYTVYMRGGQLFFGKL